MQSNIKVDAKIPLLTGPNYQEWKRCITAYLQAMDLWMVTSGLITRPVPANPNNVTDDERQAINIWDSVDYHAQGYLALYCEASAYDQVEAHLNQAGVVTSSNTVWLHLATLYSAVSPTQVYHLFKQTLSFKVVTAGCDAQTQSNLVRQVGVR
jgi:hypothetical protein